MKCWFLMLALAVISVPTMASSVSLSPSNCVAVGDGAAGADFTGSLTFEADGSGGGLLTVTLQNLSVSDIYLTAFTFDAAGGTASWTFDVAQSSGLGEDWINLPFNADWGDLGERESGARLDIDQGAGPTSGLASGGTAVWVFTGSYNPDPSFPIPSASDFLDEWDGSNIVIGFDTGASTAAVPGVGGVAGLASLGLIRRRRR